MGYFWNIRYFQKTSGQKRFKKIVDGNINKFHLIRLLVLKLMKKKFFFSLFSLPFQGILSIIETGQLLLDVFSKKSLRKSVIPSKSHYDNCIRYSFSHQGLLGVASYKSSRPTNRLLLDFYFPFSIYISAICFYSR